MSDMIQSVVAIPIEAPLDADSQVTAFGPRRKAAALLVEVRTHDGVVGYGEALARYSLRSYKTLVDDLLAPRLIGRNPFHVEALWAEMSRVVTGKAGGILFEAIAACDIAIWDVMARSVAKPLHEILGSMGRTYVPAYASSITWAEDRVAIPQIEGALAAGFKSMKLKLGPPISRALARARRVREIVGTEIELTADANWAFDYDDSLRLGRRLAELDFAWLEEPMICEDVEGYVRLRQALPLRLAAGESEHTAWGCRDLIARGGVGVIQPDVARAGGITETRRIASFAHVHGIPFAPHVGFCGAVCNAASLQLAAAAPNFMTFEAMVFGNPLRENLATSDIGAAALLVDGKLPVPTGPGLGIEIDPDALRRFRCDL